MTELKDSFHEETPPMVQAEFAPDQSLVAVDVLHVNVDENNDEEAYPDVPTLQDSEDEQAFKERTIGAGVASGVVGLLVGGPVLGLLAGFGAAHASQKDGAIGDTARAVGDLALDARDRAREIDTQHNVVERSSTAAQGAWERAQELDQENRYLERGSNFAKRFWSNLVDFVKKHNLLERGVDTIGRGVVWTAETISRKFQEQQERQQGLRDETTVSTQPIVQ